MKKSIPIIALAVVACLVLGCEEGFSIKKVSPPIGVIGGGEPIDILGSGFNADMGISVYFGNTKVDNVVIRSTKKMTISSPGADGPGPVNVRIATDDGKEFLIKDAFTYVAKSNMDIRDLGMRKSLREN
jgi:hypothetical protein